MIEILDKTQVTVEEYRSFLERFTKLLYPVNFEVQLERPWRPVVGISLVEAAAFCASVNGRLPIAKELREAFSKYPSILRICPANWEWSSTTLDGSHEGYCVSCGESSWGKFDTWNIQVFTRKDNLGFRCVRPAR